MWQRISTWMTEPFQNSSKNKGGQGRRTKKNVCLSEKRGKKMVEIISPGSWIVVAQED